MDTNRLWQGAAGGLVGGIVFGLMMQMMGMLEMVAGLVGRESVAIGWGVRLGISALFGLGFGLILGAVSTTWVKSLSFGALYGAVWWVLGALVIMPAMLGMSEMIFAIEAMQLQSLTGHVIHGLLLGGVFQALAGAQAPGRAESHA